MEDFERQLRNALERREQPAWFEAKVLAATRTRQSGRRIFWRWATEVTAVILLAGGFWLRYDHEVQERAAGQAAKARLQLALRVTVTELSKIQNSVRTSTEEE